MLRKYLETPFLEIFTDIQTRAWAALSNFDARSTVGHDAGQETRRGPSWPMVLWLVPYSSSSFPPIEQNIFELDMSFGEIKIVCLILAKTKLVLNTSYHEEVRFSARLFPANSLYNATAAHVNNKWLQKNFYKQQTFPGVTMFSISMIFCFFTLM